MRRRSSSIAVGLLFMIFLLASCSALQNTVKEPMTPKQNYLTALTVWNDQVTTYNAAYKGAGPETQAKWKAQIDPAIQLANAAIRAWGSSINTVDESAKFAEWERVRDKALTLLLGAGIIKVQEGK